MNINHEIQKLERILYVPNLQPTFGSGYVTLDYYQKATGKLNRVGTLTFSTVNAGMISSIIYDTGPQNLANLDWSAIYFDNREVLNNLVESQLGTSAEVTIGKFRILYARPKDSIKVHRFEAFFEHQTWRVYDHDSQPS